MNWHQSRTRLYLQIPNVVNDMSNIHSKRFSICYDCYHSNMLKPLNLTKQGELLEKKSITKLLKAFSHVYPRLYYELELLRNDLVQDVESYKDSEQSMQKQIDTQNKCSHTFNIPTELAVRNDKRRKKMIKTCTKCGRREIFEIQSWP